MSQTLLAWAIGPGVWLMNPCCKNQYARAYWSMNHFLQKAIRPGVLVDYWLMNFFAKSIRPGVLVDGFLSRRPSARATNPSGRNG